MNAITSASLLAGTAVVGSLTTLAWQHILAPRVTSDESHAVWNYIVESDIKQEMEARFNQVNGNWPPKRSDMALVMLEARVAAEEKIRQRAK
jgi:hypothetical protein